MTTIVYRDGILASDSQITNGDLRQSSTRKIFGCDRGIGGAAGKLVDAHLFNMWIQAGAPDNPPKIDDHAADGIFIHPTGETFLWDGTEQLIELQGPFFAFGSGHQIAVGALAQGASAIEAVHIAIQYDTGSGGAVQTLALNGEAKCRP